METKEGGKEGSGTEEALRERDRFLLANWGPDHRLFFSAIDRQVKPHDAQRFALTCEFADLKGHFVAHQHRFCEDLSLLL